MGRQAWWATVHGFPGFKKCPKKKKSVQQKKALSKEVERSLPRGLGSHLPLKGTTKLKAVVRGVGHPSSPNCQAVRVLTKHRNWSAEQAWWETP